jgi:dipeptidyl aminopeptidase/acylaminoacyl peptidase
MASFATPNDGFDYRCGALDEARADLVIAWFPVSDVVDMAYGPMGRPFARAWIGRMAASEIQRLSPQSYVAEDTVPVLTIHGDADPIVPYYQSVQLHQLLADHHVRNELVTVTGGGHADFSSEQQIYAFTRIQNFINTHLLGRESASNQEQSR